MVFYCNNSLEFFINNSLLSNLLCTKLRQECIPVGCVLSVAKAFPGRSVCLLGGVSSCQITPMWTERQTRVKILPCRNYVVDGNELKLGEIRDPPNIVLL